MRFDNRQYPYPVFGIDNDIAGIFKYELTVTADAQNTLIQPIITMQNDSMEELIIKGKAVFQMHIYCRGTHFRESKCFSDPISCTHKINTDFLNGPVEVDLFITATENFDNYICSGLNEVFSGSKFQIKKGYILAYAGKGQFYANKSPEKLKAVSSFMRIKRGEYEIGPIRIEYDDPIFVIVKLSRRDYDVYDLVKGTPAFINILHSSIVFPALLEIASFINRPEETGSDEFKDSLWYISLIKLFDEVRADNLFEKIQKILDLPVNRTLIDLENIEY